MSPQREYNTVEQGNSGLRSEDSSLSSKNISKTSETSNQRETRAKKSFSERWKTSRFWFVRGSFHVLRSVWMVAMLVGGLIAWLISLLFI